VIDFNKTRQYTLSIRLSTDGFCFAVHNPEAVGQFAYIPYRIDTHKSLTANLKEAVKSTDMLRYNYKRVNIIVAGTNYTLVPKEYYADTHKQDFYRQNFTQDTTNITLLDNVVADDQAVVIFAIEKTLHSYINERYPKANIYAAVSMLIDYTTEKSYTTTHKHCLAHIQHRQVDLVCCEKAQPRLVNTFKYKDTADALYYLLNCWSILGLNQTEDMLHLIGSPSRSVRKMQHDAAQFIQHIHLVRPAEEFHTNELARIDELPFDLQILIACE